MAQRKAWYQCALDVGLRATLEEHGFRREGVSCYVCKHSPDRVWIFEVELSQHRRPFRDWTAIFVPAIEDIVTRVAPEIGTHETFLDHPSQFKTSVAELVKLSRGWDMPTWKKNEKPWYIFLGRIQPPRVEKAIP